MSKVETRFNPDCSNAKSMDSLYTWIDTIPLSRPKRSIARDFADGVLAAEVVAHFIPKIVEIHNYPAANSWTQKRVNWQTLNRKVFVKIGLSISDEIVEQVIDAKAGVIEQVLWDIRNKLEQLTAPSEGKLHRWSSRSIWPTSQNQMLSKGTKRKSSITSHSTIIHESQLTYRVSNSSILTTPTNVSKNNASNALSANITDASEYSIQKRKTSPGYIPPPISNTIPNCDTKKLEMKRLATPPANSTHQYNSAFVHSPSLGYIAPPTVQCSPSAHGGLVGPVILSPVIDKNDNLNLGGPPAQIIYRGHKMIPLQFLDDKEKEIKNLESSNRSLTLKIHRLETMVTVKDQRIEDLTHQLQNLRSMYERVTESAYTGS